MNERDKAVVQMAIELFDKQWQCSALWSLEESQEAAEALRQLLEQPEQEPDEWLTGCPECGMDSGCDCDSGTWNSPIVATSLAQPEDKAKRT